jgi:hypothetical protein
MKSYFDEGQAAALTIKLLGRFDPAKLDERLPARFLRAHARVQIVFDVHLEVAFHLRGQLLFAPPLDEHGTKT